MGKHETTIIDQLFLELAQFTSATTPKELALETENRNLRSTGALKDAQEANLRLRSDLEMYARAWARELGGSLLPKTHLIDALVLTTKKLVRERQEALDKVKQLEVDLALSRDYAEKHQLDASRNRQAVAMLLRGDDPGEVRAFLDPWNYQGYVDEWQRKDSPT